MVFDAGAQTLGERPAGWSHPCEPLEERRLLSGLPLSFVENRGQWGNHANAAKFAAWDQAMVATFSADAVRLADPVNGAEVDLVFQNSAGAKLRGQHRKAGVYNFYTGNDPSRWHEGVRSFGSILYDNLYAGIDVRVRRGGAGLAYDVLLDPNADLGQLVIQARGATGLAVDAQGSLIISTAQGQLRQSAPVSWELLANGRRQKVKAHFRVIDSQHFSFVLPRRDPSRPLLIDPGLEWSTYVGGSQGDSIAGMAVVKDGSKDIVFAGTTSSPDFPATSGSLASHLSMPYVARLSGDGRKLVYATIFGNAPDAGAGQDFGVDVVGAMALDSIGAPVVVGDTEAGDFPTTSGAFQRSRKGFNDVFVSRFDVAGRMVHSTLLGGGRHAPDGPFADFEAFESGQSVTVDSGGNVIVGGMTQAPDFPTTAGAYDRSHNQAVVAGSSMMDDLFITRLSPTLSMVTYSTFLGGEADEEMGELIAGPGSTVTLVGTADPTQTVDDNDNYIPLGRPFPTTGGAHQRKHQGGKDAILARLKLDANGSKDLVYATILGGREDDFGNAIAADPKNPHRLTIVGETYAWNFPTTPGALRRTPISPDERDLAYAAQFDLPAKEGAAGALRWSTLLGGAGYQYASDVAVDPSGDVVMVGGASPWGEFPTTPGAFQPFGRLGNNAQFDAFVSRISADGKRLVYSTFLGGSGQETSIYVDSAGAGTGIIAGQTSSEDFPTTPGVLAQRPNQDEASGATLDVFLSSLALSPVNPADTIAPPAPQLIAPAAGSSLSGPIAFDWTDVTDSSGIAGYQVQVAPNEAFAMDSKNLIRWTNDVVTPSRAEWSLSAGTYWWRVRAIDGANNFSAWSAPRRLTAEGGDAEESLSAVVIRPDAPGGSSSKGTILLHEAAPTGGLRFTLASNNPAARVPATVTVPAGKTSVTFDISTRTVAASTPVRISVESSDPDNFGERFPVLWVDPASALKSFTLKPPAVSAGRTVDATVTLTSPARAGGTLVRISFDNPKVAEAPASVLIPAGATSATFQITTRHVAAITAVKLNVEAGGVKKSAALTVVPPAKEITVKRAEYETCDRELRIDTSSAIPTARLQVFDAATGKLIGTLTHEGQGRHKGRFITGLVGKIVIRSSAGGSITLSPRRE